MSSERKVRKLSGRKPPTPNKSAKQGGAKKAPNPTWWLFTKEQVAFVQAARELSARLEAVYGDGVSISLFGKLIVEFVTLDAQQQALVHLDERCLELFKRYTAVRESREAQRCIFRGSTNVDTIETALEKVFEINRED